MSDYFQDFINRIIEFCEMFNLILCKQQEYMNSYLASNLADHLDSSCVHARGIGIPGDVELDTTCLNGMHGALVCLECL